MATSYPELDFRKKLFTISNRLGRHELDSLKFLVTEDLPTSTLERIATSFELFCALEDSHLISEGNEDLLNELLGYIQRGHLINCSPPSSPQIPSILLDKFRCDARVLTGKLFTPIANGLTHGDFRNLRCFFIKANDPNLGYQQVEEMSGAIQLFQTLLLQGVLTPGNLGLLWDILHTIARKDLCKKIEEFHKNPPAHTATRESGELDLL